MDSTAASLPTFALTRARPLPLLGRRALPLTCIPAAASAPHRHLRAVAQAIEIIDRDHHSCLKAVRLADLAVAGANLDWLGHHRLIFLHHKNERSFRAALNRTIRRQRDIVMRF